MNNSAHTIERFFCVKVLKHTFAYFSISTVGYVRINVLDE